MNNSLFGFLLFLLVVPFIVTCEANEPFSNKSGKWKLVWEDNFDYNGLPDSRIWNYEHGYVRNNEAQYYTKGRLENARVEDGNLIIEARNDNWEGNKITSASLHTFGTKSILYGRVEVRALLPTGKGTWPAIWMLGNSIQKGTRWPDCGEIDIMENVGFDPDVVHANIHTKAYNHVLGTGKGNKIELHEPYKKFYTYTIEWHPDRIEFYVDDDRYFVYENEKTGEATWPFDKPHYLILNLAIGGGWGGQKGIDQDIFPQKYLIDYVRVYELVK
ncbi:MAG TPA: glycoside hydrolase family 16 protein [Mariniphaga sp.]|nr:glycoside hydrolase family 16 protein [Mariniphaga sp.]